VAGAAHALAVLEDGVGRFREVHIVLLVQRDDGLRSARAAAVPYVGWEATK
jgi:hypothetical protein